MDFVRGDHVNRVTDQGLIPARVVIGTHMEGEFEVVILCDPADWPDGPLSESDEGYWGEWMYPWPVECVEPSDHGGPLAPPGSS